MMVDHKGTRGTYPVQQLTAHDLREVQVIMRNYVEPPQHKEQRRLLAADYLGVSDTWY